MPSKKQHLYCKKTGRVITIYEHAVSAIIDQDNKLIIILDSFTLEMNITDEERSKRANIRKFLGSQLNSIQITLN